MTKDEAHIREAVNAAENFARWSRFHLEAGRPEHFERAVERLVEALDRVRSAQTKKGARSE